MAKDFQAFGVKTRQRDEDVFEVWQVNWKSVVSFLQLDTQWRVAGTPAGLIWIGLDYTAAGAALGRKRLRRRLDDLRVMEAEALSMLNAGDEA